MKVLIIICIVMASTISMAETVDVKGIGSGDSESTSIQIHKGKKAEELMKGPALWEIQDGTADVEGEAAPLAKPAKESWSKACSGWKKEMREDNKENKIISLNCGLPTCLSEETGGRICRSKATYKIKTKLN